MANATNHARGVFDSSGTRQTISVTEAKSCLPVTSGARCVGSLLVLSRTSIAILMVIKSTGCNPWTWVNLLSAFKFRIRIPDPRQVRGARLDVQFSEHFISPIFCLALGHGAGFIA